MPSNRAALPILLAAAGLVSVLLGVTLLVGVFAGRGSRLLPVSRGGDEPARAGFRGDAPVGLFFMTRFWSFTGSLEKAAWYFAPDGSVYRGLARGFSDADLAAHKGPKGTYAVDDDTMTITWSDGKKTTSEVERDGSAFTWDMGIFTPVEPFDDRDPLVGRWEGGESLSGAAGRAAMSKTLDLREDGTFTWSSIAFVGSESDQTEITAGAQSGTTGQWSLDGHALVLTDESGKEYRGIAFPYDDEKTEVNPDRFFFAGIMYKRQDS